MPDKVVSFEAAIERIPDGGTVSICGAWMNVPDATLGAIEERFLLTGHPRDLTAIFAICPGGLADQPGINHLAHEGLLRCVVGGSYPNADSPLRRMITGDLIEAYNLPSGMIASWYREIGAGRPGVLSRTGLGTFVDPRQTGGRMNSATSRQLLSIVQVSGEEWLFLPSRLIDVAVVRASTSDEMGNLTFEQESATTTAYVQAAATRASGGTVIAQVKSLVQQETLNPHHVKVPGTLVDLVVVDPGQKQTSGIDYDPRLSGRISGPWPAPVPCSELEHMICRRATQELRDGDVVVIGYGISGYVPHVLLQKGLLNGVTFAVEQGSTGGLPLPDSRFGNSINPQVILDVPAQFELFQGGCFDIGMLSFMQADVQGRVNVHLLNGKPNLSVGIGGFLDIANNARRLVFLGYFTAGGLDVRSEGGRIRILQEGKSKKFVRQVDNISFDPRYGRAKDIVFITERAVLQFSQGRFEVSEVAPGVDVERDVLGQMEFTPGLSEQMRTICQV